jgi:hypothetical protein
MFSPNPFAGGLHSRLSQLTARLGGLVLDLHDDHRVVESPRYLSGREDGRPDLHRKVTVVRSLQNILQYRRHHASIHECDGFESVSAKR